MDSKKYFDAVAENWDTMCSHFFSETIREEACKKAKVEAGKTALDMGAGSGFVTEELLKHGLKVIAIDQSEKMLKIIKQKFNSNMIECKTGNYDNIPLEDNSIDYVFANMYLHHTEKPEIAIKKMTRVLKPDGKLVITDLDEHQYQSLKTEQYDKWLGFKRDDIRRWFKESGLKNISVDCTGECCTTEVETGQDSCGCSCTCGGDNKIISISIFLAYGEKQSPCIPEI